MSKMDRFFFVFWVIQKKVMSCLFNLTVCLYSKLLHWLKVYHVLSFLWQPHSTLTCTSNKMEWWHLSIQTILMDSEKHLVLVGDIALCYHHVTDWTFCWKQMLRTGKVMNVTQSFRHYSNPSSAKASSIV